MKMRIVLKSFEVSDFAVLISPARSPTDFAALNYSRSRLCQRLIAAGWNGMAKLETNRGIYFPQSQPSH